MKMNSRYLAPLMLLSNAALAHPGHDDLKSFYHPDKHILSGTEPMLIFACLALLAVVAIWLLKRR